MTGVPPARIGWCVDLLDVRPDDRVLEVGCGTGVAAALVADRLDGGCLTAIDRSPTAIARARARNARHVTAGRLLLDQVALADLRTERRFDKAFAVNVNAFWTGPATAECEVLAGVLVPGGVVHLIYEGPRRRPHIGDDVAGALDRHGFATAVRAGPTPALLCISGRRPA